MSRPYQLRSEQWVPQPIERVFEFFSDAGNLERITPNWLGFEILTARPIAMGVGSLIDYRIRWHGLPMTWRTEIQRWEPPVLFQDIQLKGPYRLWQHTHRFEAVEGGTCLFDDVEYALPFGVLGRAIHAITIRKNLENIFMHRRACIQAIFGGPVRGRG
ncbi:MAG TPA: SRPBCC family protein [Candidatus Angelobacter sp.]|nr:SRPBCC family protein [Candidatus Angelobacter sp.]